MSGQLNGRARSALYRGALTGRDGAYTTVARLLEGRSWDRSPRRCSSTHSSRLWTTCCTTSTACPWQRRSRSVCRTSTTSSSNGRRGCQTALASTGSTKAVLRRAARGLVPEDVIGKRKIGFFRNSAAIWLRRKLEQGADARLLDAHGPLSEFLDPAALTLVEDYRARQGWEGTQLVLALLVLDAWLGDFLPRATGVHAAVGGAR